MCDEKAESAGATGNLCRLWLGYFCKAKNVFDEKGLLGLKAFISNITLPVIPDEDHTVVAK